jgi:hypothetical protein
MLFKIFGRALFVLVFCMGITQAAKARTCTLPSEKICYAEYPFQQRCKPLPASFADYPIEQRFDLVFKRAPRIVKDAFCAVEEIRIVKHYHLAGTGAFVRGNNIYFDREILFYLLMMGEAEALPETQYRWSWIGGESHYFADRANLELVLQFVDPDEWELRYAFTKLLIHELGHIVDTHSIYNSRTNLGLFHCEFAHQALNKAEYESRNDLAGYEVIFSDRLNDQETSQRLQELDDAGFSSFYGRNNQFEDFAELFADYIMLEHFGVSYSLMKETETQFDLAAQMRAPELQRKLKIVKTIVNYHSLSEAERENFQSDMLACRGIFTPSALPLASD